LLEVVVGAPIQDYIFRHCPLYLPFPLGKQVIYSHAHISPDKIVCNNLNTTWAYISSACFKCFIIIQIYNYLCNQCRCEFEFRLVEVYSMQHYVIKFVS